MFVWHKHISTCARFVAVKLNYFSIVLIFHPVLMFLAPIIVFFPVLLRVRVFDIFLLQYTVEPTFLLGTVGDWASPASGGQTDSAKNSWLGSVEIGHCYNAIWILCVVGCRAGHCAVVCLALCSARPWAPLSRGHCSAKGHCAVMCLALHSARPWALHSASRGTAQCHPGHCTTLGWELHSAGRSTALCYPSHCTTLGQALHSARPWALYSAGRSTAQCYPGHYNAGPGTAQCWLMALRSAIPDTTVLGRALRSAGRRYTQSFPGTLGNSVRALCYPVDGQRHVGITFVEYFNDDRLW